MGVYISSNKESIMAESSVYKVKKEEPKTKKISFSVDEKASEILNAYFDFVYNVCEINSEVITKDKIVSDLLIFALKKMDKSPEWKSKSGLQSKSRRASNKSKE